MAFSHSFSCLLIFVIGFVFRSSNNDLRMMRYSSKTLIVLINIYMFINAISLHFDGTRLHRRVTFWLAP